MTESADSGQYRCDVELDVLHIVFYIAFFRRGQRVIDFRMLNFTTYLLDICSFVEDAHE